MKTREGVSAKVRRCAVISLLLLVSASCSSTNRAVRGDKGVVDAASEQLSGKAGADAEGSGETPAAGARRRGVSSADAATPGAGPSDGPRVGGLTGPARGKPVLIGYEGLSDNTNQVTGSVGVSTLSPSEQDVKAAFEAVAALINKRGGLAGRPIQMTYHFTDVTSGTHDSRAQESCTYFTEDKHAFAVIMTSNHSQTMTRCMAKHRTPLIDTGNTLLPHDQRDLEAIAPYLYLALDVNLSRFAIYIRSLAEQTG